jgi:NTE family protein
LLSGLFMAVMVLTLLGACANANHYDALTVIKAVAPQPVVAAELAAPPKLGIAFGGGGVRGFMHLGVLRALDEAGLRADVVTGSSAGAIAAALYASGMPYRQMEEAARSVSELELADLVLSPQGFVGGRALAAWLNEMTGHQPIKALPVRLGVTVTDLGKGEALLVVDGNVGHAVQASASVPGAVMPVLANGATYVDGGVLALVPVRFARQLGADVVLAVDIICGNQGVLKGNALDSLLRTVRLQSCKLSEQEIAEADFLIRPVFEPESNLSFDQREEAILAGYLAAKAIMPALLERLR